MTLASELASKVTAAHLERDAYVLLGSPENPLVTGVSSVVDVVHTDRSVWRVRPRR